MTQIASDLSNDPVARYADAVPVKRSAKAGAKKNACAARSSGVPGERKGSRTHNYSSMKSPLGEKFR